jgi:hypothetical protein
MVENSLAADRMHRLGVAASVLLRQCLSVLFSHAMVVRRGQALLSQTPQMLGCAHVVISSDEFKIEFIQL